MAITTAASITTTTVSTDTATTADRPRFATETIAVKNCPPHILRRALYALSTAVTIDDAPMGNVVNPSADCQPIVTPPLSSLRIVPAAA
ncbi:hypothetical protein ACRAVF_31540 [Bradyrhizobium oligotrophicum S58]